MKILPFLLLVFTFSTFGQAVIKDIQFFGNSSTKLFYQKNCREVSSIPTDYKVGFLSKEEAEGKKFKLAEACSKPKPPFFAPLNVYGMSLKAEVSKPVKIESFRLKNLAEIDKNLSANMNRLLEATTAIKIGGYFGSYLNLNSDFDAFEIYDGTAAKSWTIYLYMKRGESSEKLNRQLSSAKNGTMRGTFTFQIEEETFWQRGKDRYALFGKLVNYELQEVK